MHKDHMLKACVDMMVEYDSLDSKTKNNVPCPYTDKIVLETPDGKMIHVPDDVQNMAIHMARPRPNVADSTNYDPNLLDHKLSRMPNQRSVSALSAGVGQSRVLGPDMHDVYNVMSRTDLRDHPVDGHVMPNDMNDTKYPLDLNNKQYMCDTYQNNQRRIGERGFPTNEVLRENSQLSYSIGSNSEINLDLHDESDDGMTGVNDITNPSHVLPKSSSHNAPSNYLNDHDHNIKGNVEGFHCGVDEVNAHVDQDGTLFGQKEEEFQQPCDYNVQTFDYTNADYDQYDRFDDCPEADYHRRHPNFQRYDEYSDLLEHMDGDYTQNNMWLWILLVVLIVVFYLYCNNDSNQNVQIENMTGGNELGGLLVAIMSTPGGAICVISIIVIIVIILLILSYA